MTPAELRARTHLTRAAERVGAAYSVVGLGDRVHALTEALEGTIGALRDGFALREVTP